MLQSHQQQQIPQSPYPQQQQLQLPPQHVSSVSAPNSTPVIKSDTRKPFIHGDIVMIPYGERSWYALDDCIQRQVEESLASATAAFSAEVVTLREEITRSRTERDQMVTASNISGRQYTELHREHQKALERIRTLEKPISDPNEVSRHNVKVAMELKAERDLQAEIIATLKKKLMISNADMDQAKKFQSEADLRARQTETELERTRAFGEAKSQRIGKSIEEAMEKVESLKEAESSMKGRYDDLHKINGALTKRIAELEVAALLTKSSVLPSPPIALSNGIADQVATSVPTAPNQSQSITSNALSHENDLLKNQLKIAREELKQARADVDDARRLWKGMDQGQGGEEGQVNSTETKYDLSNPLSTICKSPTVLSSSRSILMRRNVNRDESRKCISRMLEKSLNSMSCIQAIIPIFDLLPLLHHPSLVPIPISTPTPRSSNEMERWKWM